MKSVNIEPVTNTAREEYLIINQVSRNKSLIRT